MDGSQNVADVLTKLGVDKTYLFKVLREARWSLVQDPAAAALKERKSGQRAARKAAVAGQRARQKHAARHARAEEEIEALGSQL